MTARVQYQLVRSDGASWTVEEGGRLSLGRSRQNVVQIADSGVSRQHATLLVARGRCWIRDENSAHGTFVNGQRVMGQQELRVGDELRIGSAVFRLEQVPVAVAARARGAPLPQRQRRLVTWGVISAVVIVAVIVIALAAGGGERWRPPQQDSAEPPDVQTATTDSSGTAVFRDPVTDDDVNVTVVDASGAPLEGMDVVYEHGENYQYEAFFAKDNQDRVVGVGFFLHNSDHEIRVEPNVMHRANPDEAQAIAGYVDDMGKRSRDYYQKTLTCEEYEKVIKRAETVVHIEIHLILTFFGVHAVPLGRTPEYEGGREPCEGQWDWYHSYSSYLGRTEVFVYVQSQPPVMQAAKVEPATDGQVHASWQATDPTRYPEKPTYKIDTLDHTIFLGPTSFSDLVYHYRVLDDSGSTYSDWTETTRTEVEFDELPDGAYVLEVYATDEVNNHSEIVHRSFTIEGEPQDEPEDYSCEALTVRGTVKESSSDLVVLEAVEVTGPATSEQLAEVWVQDFAGAVEAPIGAKAEAHGYRVLGFVGPNDAPVISVIADGCTDGYLRVLEPPSPPEPEPQTGGETEAAKAYYDALGDTSAEDVLAHIDTTGWSDNTRRQWVLQYGDNLPLYCDFEYTLVQSDGQTAKVHATGEFTSGAGYGAGYKDMIDWTLTLVQRNGAWLVQWNLGTSGLLLP